ncbi:MAG: alpha/beta hydrolase [Deltaproteobacteria bacterium]|nr:alpha/beta hydrolase [Deltaproteobacteria bacterium]
MNLYRDFTTQEEIDREYNAVLMVPELQPYIDHDAKFSIEARNELECILDERYGPTTNETIDIFPAREPDAPILVFIHGGYWRSLNSKDFSLIARGLVLNGITVAIPNYSLCPKVSISEITQQNCASIAWLYREAHKYNGNQERIFVCGHSAGGQQAAMLASTVWLEEYDLPINVIKGGIPISSIFDLSPLYYSWLQPTLQLTHDTILRQSPFLQVPKIAPPLLISVGENESDEFKRQSADYLSAWLNNGLQGELQIQSGKNHFTTYRDLNNADSSFCKSLIKFIKRCESS